MTLLQNDNQHLDVIKSSLTVLGILGNQAMCTLNKSVDFVEKVYESTILKLAAKFFKPSSERITVLYVLEIFLHFQSKPPMKPIYECPLDF